MAAILALSIAGCGSAHVRAGVEVGAPGEREAEIMVPPPKLAGADEAKKFKPTPLGKNKAGPLPLSVVNVPVSISLKVIEDRIDELVPREIKQGWHKAGDGKQARIDLEYTVHRDRPQLHVNDGALITKLLVRFHARFKGKVKVPVPLMGKKWLPLAEVTSWGTAEQPNELMVKARTEINVGYDWRLQTSTTIKNITFPKSPEGEICVKKGIKFCVAKATLAPMVNQELEKRLRAELEPAVAEMDGKIAGYVQLPGRVGDLWQRMQCPIQLGPSTRPLCGCQGREGRWLMVNPEMLYLGEIFQDGKELRMPVGLSARPVITEGECPKSGKRPPPQRAAPVKLSGFEIAAEADLGYDDLSVPLNENMKGTGFVREDSKPVTVEEARFVGFLVHDEEPRLVIRLRLGGSVDAVIYAHARVRFNRKTGRARLADITYTAETEERFVKSAPFMDHVGFCSELSKFARFDLKAELEKAGRKLQEIIARRTMTGFYLNATVDSVRPLDYRMMEKALRVRVAARGSLEAGIKLGPARPNQ
jgi:hypothetical protein